MLSVLVVCILCFAVPCYVGFLFSYRERALSFVIPCIACFIVQHLFLVLISVVIENYQIAQLISSLIIFFSVRKHVLCCKNTSRNLNVKIGFLRAENILPLTLFVIIFTGYLLIRSHYAFIAFYNNGQDAGVEKLFNLSLQQSFLFGTTWPTEWIWLHGESIKYYVFLRSIPGIFSSHVRVMFGDPSSGGRLFILSEAFFAALTPALIAGFIFWFLRDINKKRLSLLSLITSLVCFLGVHYKGFILGISAFFHHKALDWWILPAEVIPFTHSQYPVWLMLLGDNHAYSQIYFIQVLFLGFILELTLLKQLRICFSILIGSLASVIALSHSGSVLVDLFLLSIFFACVFMHLFFKDREHLKILIFNLLALLITACSILLVTWSPVGDVKFIIPEAKLLTTPIAFFSQNFSILIFLLLTSIFSIFPIKKISVDDLMSIFIPYVVMILVLGVFLVLALMYGYHTVALIVALSLFLFLLSAPRQESIQYRKQLFFAFFACSCFLLLLLPELIAIDHTIDSRTDWIRFQMGLRVWPESYILIPLGIILGVGDRFEKKCSKGCYILFSLIASGFLVSLCLSHIPGIANRISRSEQPITIDGFSYLQRQFPEDAQIVHALRLIQQSKIVIGELCAVYSEPDVPNHFGWSGRIAAFSGRPGICGWGRHALLYNKNLESEGFIGMSLDGRINEFASGYKRILASAANKALLLESDLEMLSTFGVTHLIFGIQEKNLFPNVSVVSLAAHVRGEVLLETGDGMGIVSLTSH